MRWDNTVRYNLGARTQSQDSKILGSPNYDDGDRNFRQRLARHQPVRRAVRSSTSSYKRKMGFRVSGAGWYDNAYSHLDNTNNATANTLVNGLPVAGVAERLHEALRRRAPRANGSTRSCSRTSTSATCRSTSRPASTPSTGATACCSAARSTACRTHRTRSTSGRALRRRAAKRRSCSARAAASRRRRSRSRSCRSPAQWFYNWQADRIPESGSYLTIQDPLNFGGDSFIFGPNPLAAAIPGAPAYLRLWRAQDIKPPTNSD